MLTVKTGMPNINGEGIYASVKKAGTGFQTRTTFAKVKERDQKDDWDEIFEFFDFDELDGMYQGVHFRRAIHH